MQHAEYCVAAGAALRSKHIDKHVRRPDAKRGVVRDEVPEHYKIIHRSKRDQVKLRRQERQGRAISALLVPRAKDGAVRRWCHACRHERVPSEQRSGEQPRGHMRLQAPKACSFMTPARCSVFRAPARKGERSSSMRRARPRARSGHMTRSRSRSRPRPGTSISRVSSTTEAASSARTATPILRRRRSRRSWACIELGFGLRTARSGSASATIILRRPLSPFRICLV